MPIVRSAARRAALAVALAASAACAHRGPAPAPAPPAAAGAVRRAFEVPGRGALEIAVPPGWIAEATPGDGAELAPPTVRLSAPGAAFVATLAPWWDPAEPEDVSARVEAARLLAEIVRHGALAGAVEPELPLHEVIGEGVHGFWFVSTDRALVGRDPGPDEFRHLLRGAAATGPFLLGFTLLDQGPGPHRALLLDVVRGARHVPGGVANPHEGLAVDGGATTLPLHVRLPGRRWSVLVDLPGFVVFEPRASEGGVLVLGRDSGSGVVASIALRPASGAAEAAGCREADLPAIRAGAGVEALALASVEGAARATWAAPGPGGRTAPQAHARAWLLRDGVCASVHAWAAEPGRDDAARLERILSSARFGEEL